VKQVVFVVDDDDAVRSSLRLLLESEGHSVAEFRDAEDFLSHYDDSASGCVIADLQMPGRSGLELQQALRERRSCLPIIMLTGHADVSSAVQSLKNGAVDFLQKPYTPEMLLSQVGNAMALSARQHDEARERARIAGLEAALTPREREVMRRVAEGLSNKVIAIELDISERTVELHRARGMKKMALRSVADLVRALALLDAARTT
jgi:FixJ family two-component response regulator